MITSPFVCVIGLKQKNKNTFRILLDHPSYTYFIGDSVTVQNAKINEIKIVPYIN